MCCIQTGSNPAKNVPILEMTSIIIATIVLTISVIFVRVFVLKICVLQLL